MSKTKWMILAGAVLGASAGLGAFGAAQQPRQPSLRSAGTSQRPQTAAKVAAPGPAQPSERTARPAARPDVMGAHLLAVQAASGTPHETNTPRPEQPDLERALEEDDADLAWAALVDEEVREALASDPQLHVEGVRCTPTFCRVRMTKPIASALDWPEIDRLLAPIARGEALFMAAPRGAETTGCIYFAADDANLPLGEVRPERDEGV